jgi:hypothetical protein
VVPSFWCCSPFRRHWRVFVGREIVRCNMTWYLLQPRIIFRRCVLRWYPAPLRVAS